MTRTGDVAAPTIAPHPIGPDAPIAGWRWRPLIGLELLPQAAYVWDDTDADVTWDDTTPERVWDAPFTTPGALDAVCDWIACDIDPGEPDELYVFPPTVATVTLDNRTGKYTPWSADGRLVYWAPGRRLYVLARNPATAEQLWLFSGRVASWTVNADDTVTVVAYDGLSWLAQELGGDHTFGTPGDSVGTRINGIVSSAGYPDRVDLDAGGVTLSTVTDDRSPLETIERVALSDGGLFYGDADGSVDYRNRLWRAGRSDQPTLFTVSDNVCSVPVVVWSPELAADDERLATDVRLVNDAGLVAVATAAASVWQGDARYHLTHPDPDLWQSQAQGDTLAAYLIAQQSTPSMALQRFELYVFDPTQPQVWEMAVRTRRGDRVNVIHDYVDPDGTTGRLDLFAIVLGVAHNLTPESWTSTIQLSRTVDYRVPELWDLTRFAWDDADPANVWRY